MRTAGHSEAELWVPTLNNRARRFYEQNGWRAACRERDDDELGLTMVLYCKGFAY